MWRVIYDKFFGHVEVREKSVRMIAVNADEKAGVDPDEFNILLIGDNGVGKSSFVNAMMG